MEPDPEGNATPNKKTKLHKKRPSFSSLQIGSPGVVYPGNTQAMNVLVCVLCSVCVLSSVYSGYREMKLEGRVDWLENEMVSMKKSFVREVAPGDVLIERIRRQVEEGFHRRVSREVAAKADIFGERVRDTRDAPECLCPAGMLFLSLY